MHHHLHYPAWVFNFFSADIELSLAAYHGGVMKDLERRILSVVLILEVSPLNFFTMSSHNVSVVPEVLHSHLVLR